MRHKTCFVEKRPDLSVCRPWAGSLLEAPIPTLKCYNLHAFTIVIITKYIYIYFLYFVKYINLNTKNEFINFYI